MFDSLLGNDRIKEILIRLIKTRRIPASLLFAGEESVGKKQFALEVAKSVLCVSPKESQSCETCKSCVRAATFRFPKSDDRDAHKKVIFSENPDLGIVIPYNRYILVDAIRNLEREANFRPFEASARFFIIDQADKMNEAASNALLKTLEEPPPTSFIFLITSRPDSLLQTIRSRCQILRFEPVPTDRIEKHLLLKQKIPFADASLIARLSRGSVGRSIKTDLEKFRVWRTEMLKVLESLLFDRERSALLLIAEQISDPKHKDDFETRLETLQSLIHDVWSLRLGKKPEDLVNADISFDLKRFAEYAEAPKLARWINEIEELRENLRFNLNRKIAADALFMKMSAR